MAGQNSAGMQPVREGMHQRRVNKVLCQRLQFPVLTRSLFGLPYRLAYKKGSIAARLPEFVALLNHLETIPELRLPTHPRWQQIRQSVAARQPGALGRYEDEVDAII